jgi:DNA polymerase-3 subunit beta
MKFQILQENLEKAISLTSRFASSRAQLPILGNILFSTSKSKVFISSTNLEISASVQVGAKIEEEGEISIPSKVITELISNLPKETISFESSKEQLKISTSGFSSTVLGMDSSDFPKIPNSMNTANVNEKGLISLPKKEFTKALSQVVFATSFDESRPVLTGVLSLWSKEELVLVATDGFRLSQKKISLDGQNENKKTQKIIIPKNVLNEVSRMGEEDERIFFDFQEKEKQVLFGSSNIVLTSRLLEGEYPDYEKIIPKSSTTKVLVDKEELLRAVKLASIFAREAANVVKFKIGKESVKITAESGQSGSQETKIDAKVIAEGPEPVEWEVAFNYKFVEDFLHSVVGEEVKMEFSTIDKAGVFTDTSDSSYLHLIMPVKV